MSHIIILGVIDEMQGNIIGSGSLESLKQAVNVTAEWEGIPNQTIAQAEAVEYLETIEDGITGSFSKNDIAEWGTELARLNGEAGG